MLFGGMYICAFFDIFKKENKDKVNKKIHKFKKEEKYISKNYFNKNYSKCTYCGNEKLQKQCSNCGNIE